jgi:hypothetical protein
LEDLRCRNERGIDGRRCGCHTDDDVREGSLRLGTGNHKATIDTHLAIDVKALVNKLPIDQDIEHTESRGINTRVNLRKVYCHIILVGGAIQIRCELVGRSSVGGGHVARLEH